MDSEHPTESEQPSAGQVATAMHEAGHAVMAMIVGRPIQKVTIAAAHLPTGGIRLGAVKIQKGRSKSTSDPLEDEVLILLAGMVAESHFTEQYCRQGAAYDLRAARRLLQTRTSNQRQLEKLEGRLTDKTEHLLNQTNHLAAIKAIAAELIRSTTISGRSVRHLFEQALKQTRNS